jgi:hypothetical protein
MLNEASRLHRCCRAVAGVARLAVLLGVTPAYAELGWQQADYIKHVGPATASPMTPDQVRFTSPGGGSVLVRFAGGRSREELWQMDRGLEGLPAALRRQAEAAVKGTPVRRVDFHLEHAAAAEVFEAHANHVTIQVDRRAGQIVRIGRCRGPDPCVLLDQRLTMERATDDLMARTEQQLRRQGK